MTSLLFTSDWQCALENLDRCHMVVDQIIDIISKRRPCYVIHLGDIKNAFNPVDQRVTNFLISSIARIRSACAGFLFVRGNHDSITVADGSPSCVPLIEALGATAVADEHWVTYHLGKAIWIWMVPYLRDPARQKEEFRMAAAEHEVTPGCKFKILAFHNEVAGCEKTAYIKGMGLTLADIHADAYDVCVSGHIHRPQLLTPNLHYVGSPFCCDWGEANEEKRFLLMEI